MTVLLSTSLSLVHGDLHARIRSASKLISESPQDLQLYQQRGSLCNDGDACTANDSYDSNCNCIGTFKDIDEDGVCDADDIFPGFDGNLDSDGDGIPDGLRFVIQK